MDFLFDFEIGSSLFDLMHLRQELEQLLGRSVDVVSAGALKARDQQTMHEVIDI